MKIIILIDSNFNSFEKMIDLVEDRSVFIVDTEYCDEFHEYKYLLKSIMDFSQSESDIMVGKYSGRENIIRELGDERSEMILALSSNKNSRHYTDRPIATFLDIIKLFEKETILT